MKMTTIISALAFAASVFCGACSVEGPFLMSGICPCVGEMEVDHCTKSEIFSSTGFENHVIDIVPSIHLDGGNNQWAYDRMFDILENNGGKYDMIGMSLYPYWAEQQGETGGWQKVADDCIANINHLKQKYNKPVMICEIGMPYDQGELCKQLITKMMGTDIEGIFYWEPQAPNGYNDGYNLVVFKYVKHTVVCPLIVSTIKMNNDFRFGENCLNCIITGIVKLCQLNRIVNRANR